MLSSASSSLGNVAVIGTQWGDEGKGKLVDALAPSFGVVARATGGANAGHTIVVQGQKYVFHLLPSGLLHPNTKAVVGGGAVLHIPSFMEELDKLEKAGIELSGRVFVAGNVHLILELHKAIDAAQEALRGKGKIGTTCRGIGPCYADKANRIGLRLADLQDENAFREKLQMLCAQHAKAYEIATNPDEEWAKISPHRDRILSLIESVPALLSKANKTGERILFEGAQAHNLDLDHGTYPHVTSSNVSVGGFCTGLGVPPKMINTVIGVAKAYTTRVGGGPFPTELEDELGQQMRDVGHEYGSTTGRPRRCGWFDAVAVKRAILVNGIDSINLTKLDVLTGFSELKIATEYSAGNPVYTTVPGWSEAITSAKTFADLPENARAYVTALEGILGVPISSIGVGPNRDQLIVKTTS